MFDFQQQGHDLSLNWQIKEGYYLYRQQINITPAQANMAPLQLPGGESHEDEFFGRSEIYRQKLSLPIGIEQAAKGATLSVTYQGCADAGFCYPPETKVIPLSEVEAAAQPVPPQPSGERGNDDTGSTALPFSALWALLIGIGVAFTPCVLRMYPVSYTHLTLPTICSV